MLLAGDGASPDARAAFACFLCAAESDDAEGHAMLGHCLENGRGTEKDLPAATGHYRHFIWHSARVYRYGKLAVAGPCSAVT